MLNSAKNPKKQLHVHLQLNDEEKKDPGVD